MKLLLKRKYLKPNYTIGDLYIDGEYFCDVVEDRVRDLNKDGDLDDVGEGKVATETAIPYGIYDVELSMSPKFKRLLPMILNVKHFTGIRIHKGSSAKSSHGCLIVGRNTLPGRVTDSEECEKALVSIIQDVTNRGEEIQIEII